MTKIYEALVNAQRARKEPIEFPYPKLPGEFSAEIVDHEMEDEMIGLYKSIDALLNNSPKKVIQFIGSQVGEGTSTIAREFARIAAVKLHKDVLLLDADRCKPSQHQYFEIRSRFGWVEALQEGKNLEEAFSQFGNSRLYVSPSCNSASFTPEIFDSCQIDDFWKLLRQRFDLVLIDSAPLALSPDGLAFAPKVDGVVLVVEANKTRWRVAENLKESILKVGGSPLGIVFNKRRYFIPKFLYKRL